MARLTRVAFVPLSALLLAGLLTGCVTPGTAQRPAPPEGTVRPPAIGLPPEVATLSGRWVGRMEMGPELRLNSSFGQQPEIRIVVEQVTEDFLVALIVLGEDWGRLQFHPKRGTHPMIHEAIAALPDRVVWYRLRLLPDRVLWLEVERNAPEPSGILFRSHLRPAGP